MTEAIDVMQNDVGVPFEDPGPYDVLDPESLDFSGATVKFHLKRPDGTVFIRNGTFNDVDGVVTYESVAEDFAVQGAHYQQWKIHHANGIDISTFPSDDYNRINVMPAV